MKPPRSPLDVALALLATAEFALSLIVHMVAWGGVDVGQRHPQVWVLHVVIMLTWVAIIWRQLRRGRPTPDGWSPSLPPWGVRLIQVSFAYALVNFVLYLVQSHGGGPDIEHGQYVLSSHGRVLQVLSEAGYHHYRALELRGVSGLGAFFSLYAALVLWFDKALPPRAYRPTAEPKRPLADQALQLVEGLRSSLPSIDWEQVRWTALCAPTALYAGIALGVAAGLFVSPSRAMPPDNEATWSLLTGLIALAPSLWAATRPKRAIRLLGAHGLVLALVFGIIAICVGRGTYW